MVGVLTVAWLNTVVLVSPSKVGLTTCALPVLVRVDTTKMTFIKLPFTTKQGMSFKIEVAWYQSDVVIKSYCCIVLNTKQTH